MKKLFTLIFLSLVLGFQACQKEDVQLTSNTAASDTDADVVLKNIKALGYTETQIRSLDGFYLVDGDIYFSKTIPATKNAGVKHLPTEKYPVFNIRFDNSISPVHDQQWIDGVKASVEAWNADENVHFHFAVTTAADAHITVMKDNNLPEDVCVASDYPVNDRIGATIRINPSYNAVNGRIDMASAVAHSLLHCSGLKHQRSSSANAGRVASSGARTETDIMMYAVQGDDLWSRNMSTQKTTKLTNTWEGSGAMGNCLSYVFITQFGILYRVDASGQWTNLGRGWDGASSITRINYSSYMKIFSKLFIIQDNALWSVSPLTGDYNALVKNYPEAVRTVAFKDLTDNTYKIAVLTETDGVAAVDLISTDGTILKTIKIPHKKNVAVGYEGLTVANGVLRVYHQGYLYNVNTLGDVFQEPAATRRRNLQCVASTGGNVIWLIDDGNLWSIQPDGFYVESMLDRPGDWSDVTVMTAF